MLDTTFTTVSLLGFMVSVIFTASGTFGELGTWGFQVGFALTVLFTLLVISSMVSLYPDEI
ncbi:MAG: hypothetical protein ACMXYK_05670 [Candidatus Woesearchaeota archaeon]